MKPPKTKFICTIGPSTWDPKVIKKMIDFGMTCARVNGAFADKQEMIRVTELIRGIDPNIALMIDTKGPEVRLNKFPNDIDLSVHKLITIGSSESDPIYPQNYKDIYKMVKKGQIIRVGDGDVELKVKKIDSGKMICEVISGKFLKPGKALNFVGLNFSKEILTEKDKQLIKYAKQLDWDFVSASFISSNEDVQYLKKFLGRSSLKIVAKIENQKGVENIEEIMPDVYAIMVARGGLGVELGFEGVPAAQDEIVQKCIKNKKTVIVATQFLESMTSNPIATRAEVDGVSNVIEDGVDCVMLSAETTTGAYPVEAVETLYKVAFETERRLKPLPVEEIQYHENIDRDSFIKATVSYCKQMKGDLDLVIAVSQSGGFARLLGKYQIPQEIVALVEDKSIVRKLSIDRGVSRSFSFDGKVKSSVDFLSEIKKIIHKSRSVKKNQKILIVSDYLERPKANKKRLFEVWGT